ncbi:MAG: hypothetical protein IBX69_18475 [Anaerolineales bacterium]|nr:hypothetical protein [Anaerolineales bacterium]
MIRETACVTAIGGRIVLVDIGLLTDNNRRETFFARLGKGMGDYLYDRTLSMREAVLALVIWEEYSPGEQVRAVAGQKG